MKLFNPTRTNLKSKTLGLAMAAVLIPGGLALAHDGRYDSRSNVSGHVEVVHEIPGGVVTVGADWGKRRSDPPPVVIVQEAPRREVVYVEKEHDRGWHGRGHGRGHHKDREVTIIREEPRRTVTVIKSEPVRCEKEKVVVIEKRDGYDHHRSGDNQYYSDGKQVSYTHNGNDGQYQYYKDANQVSESKVDGSGTYHYYEDANQVSIQDNRDGRQRNVYVRK
ncbi:MAG: hypothetical protein JWP91_3178 [Fibrobacteres bacterium]|nr:hypothetical protein [Fibrobacterota bacterium]